MTGQDFKRSTHPSLSYILLCFPLTIKKNVWMARSGSEA
jgi:hypothetical protein